MLFPCLSAGIVIQHHGLDIVHGVGETGFRCVGPFKFIPQGPKFLSFFRNHAEKSIGALGFSIVLFLFADSCIGIGVTGINFHQVMNQQHGHRFEHIDFLIAVF